MGSIILQPTGNHMSFVQEGSLMTGNFGGTLDVKANDDGSGGWVKLTVGSLSGAMAALAGPGRLYLGGSLGAGLIHEIDAATGRWNATIPSPIDRPTTLAGIGDDLLAVADWGSVTAELIDRQGAAFDDLTLAGPPGSLAGDASVNLLADFDHDADVDLVDLGFFQRCFTGAFSSLLPGCEPADINADGRVDLADYALLPPESTGP